MSTLSVLFWIFRILEKHNFISKYCTVHKLENCILSSIMRMMRVKKVWKAMRAWNLIIVKKVVRVVKVMKVMKVMKV